MKSEDRALGEFREQGRRLLFFIELAECLGKSRIGEARSLGIDHVIMKHMQQTLWKDVCVHQWRHQVAECLLPLRTVCLRFPSVKLMNDQVGNFMYVGNQEEKRMTVVVNGDSWDAPVVTGKVTDLGNPALTKFEFKWMLLPELEAVGQSGGWNMFIQN